MNAMPASPGTLAWTDDLDEIWGYVTSVRGIHGAGLFDSEGLPLALGRDCAEGFLEMAPLVLEAALLLDATRARWGHAPVATLHSEDPERFWYASRLEGFWVVVTGARGSFELFKGRIDRCTSMSTQVLRDRRLIPS